MEESDENLRGEELLDFPDSGTEHRTAVTFSQNIYRKISFRRHVEPFSFLSSIEKGRIHFWTRPRIFTILILSVLHMFHFFFLFFPVFG